MRQLSLWIALLGLVGLCGCGGGGADVPDLGGVTGKLTVNGQPLANAVVTFNPVADGRPSSGVSDSDGTYELMYTVDNAGATIGQHSVVVTAGGAGGDYEGDAPEKTAGLPASASDGSIKQDVKAGDNQINIDLTGPAAGENANDN